MADVQRRRLGRELRRLREATGMDQAQAAEVLERDRTTISRLESGARGVRKGELGRLLDAYGVTDPGMREELWQLARAGAQRGWWAEYASSLSPNYASYISFESEAHEIYSWEPMLVPGLLQTEDYAREVIRGIGREISHDEVERRVEIRLARQAQLAKTQPRLWVVLDEAALVRRVGNPETMRAQLRHILQLADEPKVTVQVVPLTVGVHPGVMNSLTILTFPPPDEDVVYLETGAGDLYPVDDVARACKLGFDHLRACALDSAASVRRIARAIREQ